MFQFLLNLISIVIIICALLFFIIDGILKPLIKNYLDRKNIIKEYILLKENNNFITAFSSSYTKIKNRPHVPVYILITNEEIKLISCTEKINKENNKYKKFNYIIPFDEIQEYNIEYINNKPTNKAENIHNITFKQLNKKDYAYPLIHSFSFNDDDINFNKYSISKYNYVKFIEDKLIKLK